MTEPQSVALIREALAKLDDAVNDEYGAASRAKVEFDYRCQPGDIREILQHVAALSAQVRDLEADAQRSLEERIAMAVDQAPLEADALRWRACKGMRREWWMQAMENAGRPLHLGGQSLDDAIDEAMAAAARGEK